MSDQVVEPTDQAQEPEAIELPPQGDAAFSALMDALAPEEAGEEAGEGGAPVSASDDGAGQTPAPAEGAGDAGGAEAAAAEGAAGQSPVPQDGAGDSGAAEAAGATTAAGGTAGESGGGALPETWTASAVDLIPKLGQLSTALEERTTQAYQQSALTEVREEHSRYFEALEKHPRLLVGQNVPSIGGEGEETLRDTADAREWQEAVKSILVDEVRDRASRASEENKDFLETVHASIELFQNNSDLVPGTKDFDVELANRFATLAEPYELRVEGKLQGYSIPVQPIINQLRAEITAQRAAQKQPTTPPKQPAQKQTTAPSADKPDSQPQAGIQSKAGASGEAEDFSTLFGTIGLPNLRI